MGSNSHPHPRTKSVAAILQHNSDQYDLLRKENGIADRGKETIQQFGNQEETLRCVKMLFLSCTYVSMRTRMDLLMSQYMLLRGEDRRHAEFPDIFTTDSINEGHKGNVPMLILRLGHGKVITFHI